MSLSLGASKSVLDDMLLEAAKEGDVTRLNTAIRLGGDVHAMDSRGTEFSVCLCACVSVCLCVCALCLCACVCVCVCVCGCWWCHC